MISSNNDNVFWKLTHYIAMWKLLTKFWLHYKMIWRIFFFTKLDLLTRNDASAIEKPITLRIMVIRKYINHDLMQTNIHQFDVYRNFPISQFKDQRTLAWTIYRKARTRIECQTLFIKTVDISKKNAIFAVIFYYKSFLKTTTYLPNKHFLQNTHVYFAGLLSID